jgi:hypothetical protein
MNKENFFKENYSIISNILFIHSSIDYLISNIEIIFYLKLNLE